MSDLFHELVPDEFVYSVFDAMGAATRHEFQVLTKRPQRMKSLLTSYYSSRKLEPLANVWVGVSIENNRWVRRADELRETPAQIRFVSAEPLLGPLPELDLRGIDWLIVGGESGPGWREMHPAWVRALRDQAVAAGVAFYFKQWGGLIPKARGRRLDGQDWAEFPTHLAPPR